MPISTLYASPANMLIEAFWAFQPKRLMVPLFATRFGWPPIPSLRFRSRSEFMLAMIALSWMDSISPRPNSCSGMRKATLRRASSVG